MLLCDDPQSHGVRVSPLSSLSARCLPLGHACCASSCQDLLGHCYHLRRGSLLFMFRTTRICCLTLLGIKLAVIVYRRWSSLNTCSNLPSSPGMPIHRRLTRARFGPRVLLALRRWTSSLLTIFSSSCVSSIIVLCSRVMVCGVIPKPRTMTWNGPWTLSLQHHRRR